ncbi:PREDICTED: uncharacterized protein LOC107328058 [Acropora digitifera]|uniref:uncharacterized protein LOC107328058 n=1 Tax=Acropora digitifera TaxID=70779 RepID=UPI00077AD3B5|nr:PREDICTED: uncharacterized protein LOC107328058 [Acropora digitifera]
MTIVDMSEEQLTDVVLDAGVSIDGSWNQRGWSARDGVVAVISIDTGKVLDVAFLSNSCTACEQMKRKQQEGTVSRMDYLGWVISHEENCYHNHEGSSQSMEARGSCLLFGRSLDKHKLRYIPFVGDGDSKSYTKVCKLAPYGPAVYNVLQCDAFPGKS